MLVAFDLSTLSASKRQDVALYENQQKFQIEKITEHTMILKECEGEETHINVQAKKLPSPQFEQCAKK